MNKRFCFCLLLCLGMAYGKSVAQKIEPSNKVVRMIARRNDSTVSLRWAPVNPEYFAQGKRNGYKLERAELSNGRAGAFTMVNENHPVMPWPVGGWYWFISKMKDPDTTKMMYLHIGFSMLFSDSLNAANLHTDDERTEAIRSQYSYAMLAADRDSMTAVGLGMRFEDYFITPGKRYLYRITLLGDLPKGMSATDSVVVGGEPYRVQNLGSLRADEQERAVTLYWNKFSDYTAHRVERSDNGGKTFFPLNASPLVTLITGDTIPGKQEFYADSGLTNYKIYFYRVYGYTSFGSDELIGEIKAMPRDRTPPEMPTEVHADNIASTKVKITWVMNDPVDGDLAGFHIGKDTVDEGDSTRFPHVTKKMLPATAREFIDESGRFADKNYYVVEAYDTARNMVRSFSAYCVMIDSTPPEPPHLVRGIMDTNGVVIINFKPPKDRDYKGYRLLMANDSTHEFSVIKERFTDETVNVASETTVRDTESVQTLTPYVYYKMYAIDFHFNESQMSNMLPVKRPDLIPPVAPVITGYLVSDSGVVIEFVPSSSEDAAYNKLMRRRSGESKWDSIASPAKGSQTIFDKDMDSHTEFEYALQAADYSGLFSEFSNSITARTYQGSGRRGIRSVKGNYNADKSEVNLSWDVEKIDDGATFVIYRGEDGQLSSYSMVKIPGTRKFRDATPPKKGEVRYAVKVIGADGWESKLSDPVIINIR